jgi:hypothetical protein
LCVSETCLSDSTKLIVGVSQLHLHITAAPASERDNAPHHYWCMENNIYVVYSGAEEHARGTLRPPTLELRSMHGEP